jgi:hypothetical protein
MMCTVACCEFHGIVKASLPVPYIRIGIYRELIWNTEDSQDFIHVIIIYPGLDISLFSVYITSAAEDSDFVTLGTAWFLDLLRLLLFRSWLDFSEIFCPAQFSIFVEIQKQSNIVAQPCHKSGF